MSITVACSVFNAADARGEITCQLEDLKNVLNGRPFQATVEGKSLTFRSTKDKVWAIIAAQQPARDESCLISKDDFHKALLALEDGS